MGLEHFNCDFDKMSTVQLFNFTKVLEDYLRVSKALENPKLKYRYYYELMQARLCEELLSLELTPEEKLELYLDGRGDELPPDGRGKDDKCGKILPTEEEVMIGMYPERALYYFKPFTCGVYHFYTEDGKFNYIGGSEYVEYNLHCIFCKWRSQANNPDKPRKTTFNRMKPVRYMLDNYPNDLRFRIIEVVPYSLLDAAVRNQRLKNKAMWQYDIKSKSPWSAEKYEAGVYNY